MLRKCAFLTLEDRRGFYIYDHLLFQPMAKLGWLAEEVPWNKVGVDWSQFDAVIIRSTWDYQASPQKFLSTLEKIENVSRLYNPLSICKWNLNKQYLYDLEKKGVLIVPTLWLKGLSKESVKDLFQKLRGQKIVVKPQIGANADDTFVLNLDEPLSWNTAIKVFSERSSLVQPFINSIQREGEYSLFYFGGNLSHAIVKRPADGDFRVQEEHGGRISLIEPAEDIICAGNYAIKAIEEKLLYARVDLVRLESGKLALIEMELIEPSLYFEQCPGSAVMFAEQFKRIADK